MNDWSGRSAMIGNKGRGTGIRDPRSRFGESKSRIPNPKGFFLLLLSLLFPHVVQAQGAAPGMFGVKEIIIQYTRFADPKTADSCGLTREDIAKVLAQDLRTAKVPAVLVADSTPPSLGVARIVLTPEIASVTNQELECTSWVSLTAESQNNAVVPPVQVLRSVKVVYWHQGTMVVSSQSVHAHLIADTLDKMVAYFAQQYHIEQPPEIK